MSDDVNALMGELRSLLNGPQDDPHYVWDRVCHHVSEWPEDGSLEQVALPYLSAHLARHPFTPRTSPVRWLRLPEHADHPRMALCDGLDLQDIYPALVYGIIESEHIQHIKALYLYQPHRSHDAALDDALIALLRSPKLAELESLHDWEGRIPLDAIQHLLSTQGPDTLRELYLGACDWRTLEGSARLGQLTGLTLGQGHHDAHDVAAQLAASPALVSFGLLRQPLRVEALAAIAANAPASLLALHLDDVGLDDAGVEALCAGSFMARARTLLLSDNNISDDGLIALLDASRALETLTLRGNPITTRGLTALVEHPHAATLTHVGLNVYKLDAEARALCESHPRLRQLV